MPPDDKQVMEQVGVFFYEKEIRAIRKAAGEEFITKLSPYIRSIVMKDLKKKGFLKNLS